jgi:hypothetical protein
MPSRRCAHSQGSITPGTGGRDRRTEVTNSWERTMKQPTSSDSDASQRRSDFYLKVAIAALCFLGFNLALAWILQYYFHNSLITNISFVANDPSWLPKGTQLSPALGVHYFGDFELFVGYATSSIPPYSSAIGVLPFYGPTSIVLVEILNGIFGWPGAVLVFLPCSLLFFLWGISRLLGSFLSARLLAILLLFTGGIILCLDRGNMQLIVAALCVWFCVGLLEDRPRVLIISLAFAIAIKIYAAVLLLVLIRERRWRDAGLLAGFTSVLYAASFAILGGDYLQSVRNFIDADLLFASSPAQAGKEFVLGRVSAAAAGYKLLYLSWGPQHFAHFVDHSPGWYIQVPGLIVGCACLAVIWLAKHPREFALIAALAMMQLTPASTLPYVGINIVIELCLLVRVVGALPPREAEHARRVAIGHPPVARGILMLCVALLIIGSAPWMSMLYGKGGASTSLGEFLAPVTNIGVVLALLVGLLLGHRREQRHEHIEGRRHVSPFPEAQQPTPVGRHSGDS